MNLITNIFLISFCFSPLVQTMEINYESMKSHLEYQEKIWEPLITAISHDYIKEVESILHKNQFSQDELTDILEIACYEDKIGSAKVLIKHGASIHGNIRSRLTPLLTYGANINGNIRSSPTPLLTAIIKNNPSLVEVLLVCGADKSIKYSLKGGPLYEHQLNSYLKELCMPEPFTVHDVANALLEDDLQEEGLQEEDLEDYEHLNSNTVKIIKIINFLNQPIEHYQSFSKEKELEIHAENAEQAIGYEDYQTLHIFLKNNKTQEDLDSLFAFATRKTDSYAMKILHQHRANAHSIALTCSISGMKYETVKELYRKLYVSPSSDRKDIWGQTPSQVTESARWAGSQSIGEFEKNRKRMRELINSPGPILLEQETGESNIFNALQKRELGIKRPNSKRK